MASAVKTFGTTATTSLSALLAQVITTNPQQDAADVAQLANAIKDDLNVAHPIYPGAWSQAGVLYVPNRGILKVLPGDWVAVDSQGWPILVSANSVANSTWVHS